MMERTFTVPGKPVGKGRPKFSRVSTGVRTYTPEKTASYETLVKWSYLERHRGKPLIEGPVSLHIRAVYEIPKSWPKKRQELAGKNHLRPVVKPDADNIIKAISDALNGIAYKDDAQIVEASCTKWYGEQAMVVVTVEGLES